VNDPDEPRLGHPLPRAAQARVDPAKLVSYSLDPASPYGRHKAAVFKAVLQIERRDWAYLRDAILDALPARPVSSINRPDRPEKLTTYGVVVPVRGKNGRWGLVVTAWTIFAGRPELTSARVAKKRSQSPEDGSTI
jgi:hypothetical protein